MTKLLKITSSTRGADSYSNQLEDAFERKWKSKNAEGEVMLIRLSHFILLHL